MIHVEYFTKFFEARKRRTAKEICDFMVTEDVFFDYMPER